MRSHVRFVVLSELICSFLFLYNHVSIILLFRPYLDDIKKWRDKTNSKTNSRSEKTKRRDKITTVLGFGIGFVPSLFYVV